MMTEIVEQQGTTHIFPNTIPKKRSNRDVVAKFCFSIVFIGVGVLLAGKTESRVIFLVNSISYSFLLVVFIQVCLRVCHLFEEYFHLQSRYDGNITKMLCDTFSINNYEIVKVILSVTVVFCAVLIRDPPKSIESHEMISWILVFIGIFIFCSILKLEDSPLNTAKLMDDLKGLDYGSGMAYSFFFGYLNIMLPCTGDERKGLKEQIEDYESKNQVQFATKKLYILIPLSAYCPTSIIAKSNYMDEGGSLHWRTLDRAGVQGRHYKNSVYKLWSDKLRKNKKPTYVCAEYATPLLTLHEVMRQDSPESRRYKKYQKEIVTNFYLTLHKILQNDRDCRDNAELIYYRDVDNNGDPLNKSQLDVGLLLLERINQEISNTNNS